MHRHFKLEFVLTLYSLIRSLGVGVIADLIARTKFISFPQIVQCSMYFAELNEILTNTLGTSYYNTCLCDMKLQQEAHKATNMNCLISKISYFCILMLKNVATSYPFILSCHLLTE